MRLVIPCYNEAERLSATQIDELLLDPRISLLLVDDGSADATADVLAKLAAERERVDWLGLDRNRGKGEAVRRGMLHALEGDAEIVGYADADFATPPRELSRLLDVMEQDGAMVVFGSRVARLGARIERNPRRHYLGRLFATSASIILDLPIYDTQCGAKYFRAGAALRHALAVPFRSRWSFDVELLGRLLAAPEPVVAERMVEVPLGEWVDVAGSKLNPRGALRAGFDLLELGLRVRRKGGEGFYR